MQDDRTDVTGGPLPPSEDPVLRELFADVERAMARLREYAEDRDGQDDSEREPMMWSLWESGSRPWERIAFEAGSHGRFHDPLEELRATVIEVPLRAQRQPAYRVACPRCGAEPLTACRRDMSDSPHKAREQAADQRVDASVE